jgi:hypothetical protein
MWRKTRKISQNAGVKKNQRAEQDKGVISIEDREGQGSSELEAFQTDWKFSNN